MKTTLNLDDDLMRTVKQRAAERGSTISAIIEMALRKLLEQEQRTDRPYRLRWITVRGGIQPGVDLTDRDFTRFPGLQILTINESPQTI